MSTPNAGECPNSSVAAQYQYSYPAYEPFGELAAVTTQATAYAPSGYRTTYQYNPANQGGTDYGLPTAVLGASIPQIDGTTRTPQQNFWYDGHGNTACYGKGNGYWVLAYDSLNRMTVAADPDDSAAGPGICGKSGVSGWSTFTSTAYFADGSISSTQDPSERAAGYSTAFLYDADGNAISETRHFNCTPSSCTPGTTTKYYDGADRLVEVYQPNGDGSRNKYDIGAADLLALQNGSTSFRAYGGLYATQILTPSSTTWMDSKGFAYDAMDRTTTKYAYAPNTIGNVGQQDLPSVTTTLSYDTDSSHLGLLSSSTNGVGTVTSYTYDSNGHTVGTAFSDGLTPSRTTSYDPDGRTVSLVASNGTVAYAYDAAGRKSSQSETNGSNALTISYQYYADGLRSALGVQGALSATGLRTYDYRNDGSPSTNGFSYGSTSNTFSWAYTNARRQLTFSDPWFSRTTAHDAYGRTSADNLETGSYTNFAFDGEGNVVSYTGLTNFSNPSANIAASQTAGFAYDQIGQNTKESYTNLTQPNSPPGIVQTPHYGCADTFGCDDRAGAQVERKPNRFSPVGDTTYTYAFDGAGRQTGQKLAWAYNTTCSEVSRGVQETYPCNISGSYQTLRSYDAEDHLIAESPHTPTGEALTAVHCGPANPYPNPAGGNPPAENTGPAAVQAEYTFWPDGHLQSTTNGAAQLFWDGDTLLYVLDAPGYSTIYLDDYAMFNLPATGASSMFMTDRDYAGRAVSEHNAAGQYGWSPNGIFQDHYSCYKNYLIWSNETTSITAPPIVLPRRDGISDLYNTFQGARSYDDNAGQWTTPDAYSGDAEDPETQRSYMWNNNNSFAYEDSSGYDSQEQLELDMAEIRMLGAQGQQLVERRDSLAGIERVARIMKNVANGNYPTKAGSADQGRNGVDFKGPPGTECEACGTSSAPMQRDHVTARSKGGDASDENRNTLCSSCNASKRDLSTIDWISRMVDRLSEPLKDIQQKGTHQP